MIFFLRIFGFFIIFGYIYMRFILQRLPRDLSIYTNQNVNYFLIYLIIISIIICLSMVYLNIKIIERKPSKHNIFSKIYIPIIKYIQKALYSITQLIGEKVPDIYIKVRLYSSKFYKTFGHYEKFLFYSFGVFPHLVVVFCFVIDVFYFFKLYYFYNALFLLAIPLIFKLWLHQITEIVGNMEEVENIFIIEHDLSEKGDKFKFTIKPEYQNEDKELLEFYVKEYLALVPLYGFLESYYLIEYYSRPRVMLFIYLIYSITWIYIAVKNCINII